MGSGCVPSIPIADEESEAGQFQPPSITVYPATAKGDQKPSRTIQGSKTQLDWPMGLAVDPVHNEIAVVNNGDNSVLFYRRMASGDVAPVRAIRGPRTRISRPMGLAIDTKNDEVWVANFADHTALAFNRTDNGDQAPKRIIRNAPAGTPSAGFGNPMAMAYDSKREEILVPN
jgi:DNA-binding beta-propeller fold protein YncE